MPSKEMWQLLNEKNEVMIEIDFYLLEEVLVEVWNKLEDKSRYQGAYMFFDSSLNSSFNHHEFKSNVSLFIDLIQETGASCPFLTNLKDIKDSSVLTVRTAIS